MTEKLQAIVLNTVRHSDRALIAGVYTPRHGHLSLLIETGSARTARSRGAMLMPLSRIGFEVDLNTPRTLPRPRAMTFAHTYRTLYFSPQKSALVFFLAEFLTKLLRESDADPRVYKFISGSLDTLDAMQGPVANFHIVFLSSLAAYMGIQPNTEGYGRQAIFDMRAGCYTRLHPGHNDILLPPASEMPLLLQRLDYATMHRLHLRRAGRAALLDALLRYWGIHFPGTSNLRTPEVLASLFD